MLPQTRFNPKLDSGHKLICNQIPSITDPDFLSKGEGLNIKKFQIRHDLEIPTLYIKSLLISLEDANTSHKEYGEFQTHFLSQYAFRWDSKIQGLTVYIEKDKIPLYPKFWKPVDGSTSSLLHRKDFTEKFPYPCLETHPKDRAIITFKSFKACYDDDTGYFSWEVKEIDDTCLKDLNMKVDIVGIKLNPY